MKVQVFIIGNIAIIATSFKSAHTTYNELVAR